MAALRREATGVYIKYSTEAEQAKRLYSANFTRPGVKVNFYRDGDKYIADTDDVSPAENSGNFFVNEE